MKPILGALRAVIVVSLLAGLVGAEAASASSRGPTEEAPPGSRPGEAAEPAKSGDPVPASEPPGAESGPPPDVLREIRRTQAAEARAQALRDAARENPQEVRFQTEYLAGLLEMERIDEAIAAGPAVVQAFPRSAEAFLHFGRALAQDGQLELARLQFQRGIGLDAANAGPHAWAARIDLMRGDLKSAEAGLRKALALDPARKDVRAWLAGLLERNGRYADAISMLASPEAGKSSAKPELTGRRALLKAFAQQPPMVLPEGFSTVTLPILAERGYPPTVSLKIGDGFEKLFVIDTGSEDVMLTRDAARALGLPEKGKETIKDGEGREYPTPAYVVLDRMTLGSLTIRRVPARVSPTLRYPDDRIAGVIGRELLGRFRPVMDYAASTLTLARGDGPPLDGVPFDLSAGILIDGFIGERPVGKFILDTSSYTPGALDYRFVASETGLSLGAEGVKPLPEGPYLFKFTMPSLEVGGLELTDFPATAVDLRLQSRRLGVDIRGVIGNAMLRGCRLEIDFKNQRLSIKRVVRPAAQPAGPPGA